MEYKFIEFNFISPISTYNFNKNNKKYYLVVINTSRSNYVQIHIIPLDNIGNVTKGIRGYGIAKAIRLSSQIYPYLCLKIFEHELDTNTINLLFSGNIELNEIPANSKKSITLFSPSSVLGRMRNKAMINEMTFLSEEFYNFETENTDNKCVLFMLRVNNTDKQVINPFIYRFDRLEYIYIFDRYNNNIIKEITPDFINLSSDMTTKEKYQRHIKQFIANFCVSGKHSDYVKYINEYQIDVNKFMELPKGNFREMFKRPIKFQYRQLKYSPYLNNVLTAPIDCRMRGFPVNGQLRFSIGNNSFSLNDWTTKSYELEGGSGFLCRLMPNDYQRISMPYSGYLTEIGIFGSINDNDSPYVISMKFENEYFMQPDVHEREYISVIYGNNIRMSRAYPELTNVQTNKKLIFYVIMVGFIFNDSIEFTNSKFIDLKKKLGLNSSTRIKPFWIQQGEEIGTFNCGGGYVIFLANHLTEFTSDIKFYSKLEENDLVRPIETYIKMNDILGLLI